MLAASALACAGRLGPASAALRCHGVLRAAVALSPRPAVLLPVAGAVAAPRFISSSAPRFGLMDRLQSWAMDGQKKKQEEKMQKLAQQQLEMMQQVSEYTLREHGRIIKWSADASGVKPTGIQALLRTDEQQKELEEAVLQDVKIAECITDEEAGDPSRIQRKEKLRIAAAAGTDVTRVNKFLGGYEQSKTVHAWMMSRKKRGLSIPSNMHDLFPAMLSDRTGMAQNKAAGGQAKPRNMRAAVKRM